MRKTIVIISALLFLISMNVSIYRKEQLLTNGRIVLLELAPVDPRSLMQGDYMALRFKVADDAFGFRVDENNLPDDGRLVLLLDERNVATFKRFDNGTPLSAKEAIFRYRIRENLPKFATNAFFFQEGHAERYAKARFGEFRVADNGECILAALRNDKLEQLGAIDAKFKTGVNGIAEQQNTLTVN